MPGWLPVCCPLVDPADWRYRSGTAPKNDGFRARNGESILRGRGLRLWKHIKQTVSFYEIAIDTLHKYCILLAHCTSEDMVPPGVINQLQPTSWFGPPINSSLPVDTINQSTPSFQFIQSTNHLQPTIWFSQLIPASCTVPHCDVTKGYILVINWAPFKCIGICYISVMNEYCCNLVYYVTQKVTLLFCRRCSVSRKDIWKRSLTTENRPWIRPIW